MRRLVVDTFRGFREMPEIIRLMNEENLHHARHIRGAKAIPALYNPLLAAIERLVTAGREQGLFRADVEPVGFYIALSGLGYFYQSNRYTLGTVLQVDLGEEGRIAAYEDLIADMVLAYLQGGAPRCCRLRRRTIGVEAVADACLKPGMTTNRRPA
jgi:TetR/AcrR family transcriptional regulator